MQVHPGSLPWLVERPRVRGLLEGRWRHRLTTVVADVGYGKTVALTFGEGESGGDATLS